MPNGRRNPETMSLSLFRLSRFGAKTRQHETWRIFVTSTFAFRDEDTKTRQTKGDNMKDFYPPTQNFQQRNVRAFAC